MAEATARLATRLEVVKLAHELDLGVDELAFLAGRAADDVRELRVAVTAALHARHQARFARLAALVGVVPLGVAARAAELAIGPVVSARVAAALGPEDAVRLAQRVSPGFLAEIALSLDPVRSAEIVRSLDDRLVVEVGRLLLEQGEHLVLARFVSVVEAPVALEIVADASPAALLEVALLADDRSVLGGLVAALDDDVLVAVLDHCHGTGGETDALSLVTSLDLAGRTRVVEVLATSGRPDLQVAFLRAVENEGAWPEVVPALARCDEGVLDAVRAAARAVGELGPDPATQDLAARLTERLAAIPEA
ncbi:hypothetical protein RDV89_05430 [Nocardioides zeae]|uniref:DUF2336 domain-containing protein n=1 Tax=Nocardioides imazamoxiresistens TaxID=3231893 RepID=A0ABU3PTG6_9ACTN|nr:hypothetical protein [Nocardioides zeae]MDT9592498.1 hypothetical protein [Nocardioides zeae]